MTGRLGRKPEPFLGARKQKELPGNIVNFEAGRLLTIRDVGNDVGNLSGLHTG